MSEGRAKWNMSRLDGEETCQHELLGSRLIHGLSESQLEACLLAW